VLRDAVGSGVLPAHLVEPSFVLEGAPRLRFGVNAASRRHDPDRAALTSALLEALGAPREVLALARRALATPSHEVFVAVADEPALRAKLYLRGPAALLEDALARLGCAGTLPPQAHTLALDLAAGRVVGLRSYEPLAPSDPRVVALAARAGVEASRAHLARRLDGDRAGEQVVHVQIEHARSLEPATRLAATLAPGRPPPWAPLAARAALHARGVARSSRGEHTVYLALAPPRGVASEGTEPTT
jgi:hypothetical protein